MFIEFLRAEVQPIDVHKSLVKVYGGETTNVSTIKRWVCHFESGARDATDKPRSRRPSTAIYKENEAHFDKLIESNWRITVNDMSTKLGVIVGAMEK